MLSRQSVSVMEVDARGVHLAIKSIEELDLQDVDIECDSKIVVKIIKKADQYFLETEHILNYCRSKFSIITHLSICHVKWQANRVAHLVTRTLCLLNCYNVFL